jgi:hypothetical protein
MLEELAVRPALVAVRPPGEILPARKPISFRKIYSKDFIDSSLETTQKSLRTKEKNGGAHSEFWTIFSQE